MSNKKFITISDNIKKGLMEELIFCSVEQMNTIISDYNSDSGLSKNEIFILGLNLSLVKKNRMEELRVFGHTSDRLFLDEIELLIKSIINLDHETSLNLQNQKEVHYYDLHVFEDENNGYSVPVKMEIDYGVIINDNDVIQFSIDNDLLDSDEKKFVNYVEEISDEDYKLMTK